ncbi:MAG: sulfotransferase domain-containing protein [Myxococcota bacterium]|nr:sulfotransferase domain-containing protein [Myxococcota bacterium]
MALWRLMTAAETHAPAPPSGVSRAVRTAIAHRLRSYKEVRKARRCDVMVLSRAKSGRTWVRAMLSRLYQQRYGLPEAQLIEFDNFHAQDPAIPRVLFTHGYYLRERLATPGWQERFRDKKAFFLVRHPCDVAVSEYFQSTKRASDHKRELYGVEGDHEMFDFVMNGPLGIRSVIEYLNGWEEVVRGLPRHLVLRYEDLRARPVESVGKAAEFLQAPFSASEIEAAVEFTSFDKLKELERSDFYGNKRLQPRDPDDPDSFKVRRGKVGGYRDYFSPEQIATMEALVRDQLSPAYGYHDALEAAAASPGSR